MNSVMSAEELFITFIWLILMMFIGNFVCEKYSILKQNFQLYVITHITVGSMLICIIRSLITIGGLL